MKKRNISFIIAGWCLLGTILATCKKDADKLFDGTGRARGIILYTNIADNAQDTARGVQLTLYSGKDTVNAYSIQSADGKFDVSSLRSRDSVIIQGRLTTSVNGGTNNLTYTGKLAVKFDKGNFQDQLRLILLPAVTNTPTVVLTVKDAAGAMVKDAKVALYTDPLLLSRNQFNGTGSVASGTTNGSGIAIFSNLQAITYYASVYLPAGSDTLSNDATNGTAIGPLKTSVLNTYPVTIAQTAASLQLTVVDTHNALIGGATVYLYADPALLASNRRKGTGSLRNGTTDTQGKLNISHLQTNIAYFVSAYKPIGKDTLSNEPTDQQALPLLQLNSQNQTTIIIK